MRYRKPAPDWALIAFAIFFAICLIAGIGWTILEVAVRLRFINEGAC